jgi:mono/diheme cytochrome c family protein
MNLSSVMRMFAVLSLAAAPGLTRAQEIASVQAGKAQFQHWCAPCHGRGPGDDGRRMLPGTEALFVKYKGTQPGALEDRSNLPLEVLRVFVRRGAWSMPAFRKTEVSDAELAAIAAYIAESSKGATSRSTAEAPAR